MSEEPTPSAPRRAWDLTETNANRPLSFPVGNAAPHSETFDIAEGITVVGIPLGGRLPDGRSIVMEHLWRKLHKDDHGPGVRLVMAPIGTLGMELLVTLDAIGRLGGIQHAPLALKGLLAASGFRNAEIPVVLSSPLSSLEDDTVTAVRVFDIDMQKGGTKTFFQDLATSKALEHVQEYASSFFAVWNGPEKNRFRLAMESVEASRYAINTRLALASLWSAAETLFSKDATEATFKMTAAWASFVRPPGPERLKYQKSLQKLYAKRSKAVHGHAEKGTEFEDAYIQTMSNLMSDAVLKIIRHAKLPSANTLQDNIFADEPEIAALPDEANSSLEGS